MAEDTSMPVRHRATVELASDEAFELFTDRFDTWWPREHHIGAEEMARVVIEPRVDPTCRRGTQWMAGAARIGTQERAPASETVGQLWGGR